MNFPVTRLAAALSTACAFASPSFAQTPDMVVVTANRTGPGHQARITPLALRTSATVRLRRLARSAVYKEELRQLVVPLARGVDPAAALVTLLRDLVPEEVASVAS